MRDRVGVVAAEPGHSSSRAGFLWSVLVVIALLGVLSLKVWLALQYRYLVWDSYVYMLNARVFLSGPAPNLYFEILRPPLLPALIASIWSQSGESVVLAQVTQPVFTIATAFVLYKLGREMFSHAVGTFSAFFFLLVPVAFFWTNQILPHGVADFFVTLAAYSLWRAGGGSPKFYSLAGLCVGLGSLSRYTSFLMIPVVVFVVWASLLHRGPEGRGGGMADLKWFVGGAILFFAAWTPWLAWNYSMEGGNALASVMEGLQVSAIVGQQQPWYYYLVSFPNIVTLPAIPLLVVGLSSMKGLSDRRAVLLITWLVASFVFFTIIPNKQPRFYTDWLMPVAMVAGVGFGKVIDYFAHSRRLVSVIAAMTVIWLASLSYVGFQMSNQDATYNNLFFSNRDAPLAIAWAQNHMSVDAVGAADFAPQLSFYAHRDFLSAASLIDSAKAANLSSLKYFAEAGVTIVIVTSEFAIEKNLGNTSGLTLVSSPGDFRVYSVMD